MLKWMRFKRMIWISCRAKPKGKRLNVMRPAKSTLKHQKRNWLELPSDVTANILSRIGMIEILTNAQKVCTYWRKICKDPAMWRVVNMNDLLKSNSVSIFELLFEHVIDRSQGQLVDVSFVFDFFDLRDGMDALLRYVADRSSVLRHLKVACRYGSKTINCLTESLMKFPLLEVLILYKVNITKETIETVGRYCPKLRTLGVSQRACKFCVEDTDEECITSYNEIAIAIGGSLHELRYLALIGSKMSNIGLQVILDGCRHLETLDLRECFYIDLKGTHITRRLKHLNHLKLLTDSLECGPYVCARHDTDYEDYQDNISSWDAAIDDDGYASY